MESEASPRLVLLVECEVQARLRLADQLQEGGLTVLPVASAEEALEVLGAMSGVQAVVLGANLAFRGMTGLEMAHRVTQEHGIGCVVLAEPDTPEGRLPPDVLALGKPLHMPTLLYLVQHVVEDYTRADQTLLPAPTASEAQTDAVRHEADWALTPRQHDILELLMQGKSNPEIAQALGLSPNTVKVHLVLIFRKLGVSSRTEAVIAGLKRQRPS
jgi:DNA-binding NarL/FixJ family response regulator